MVKIFNKLRKGESGSQIMVIGLAVTVILMIGTFIYTRKIQSKTGDVNKSVTSGLKEGIKSINPSYTPSK